MYSNLGTDGESIVSICNALNFEQKQICFVKNWKGLVYYSVEMKKSMMII